LVDLVLPRPDCCRPENKENQTSQNPRQKGHKGAKSFLGAKARYREDGVWIIGPGAANKGFAYGEVGLPGVKGKTLSREVAVKGISRRKTQPGRKKERGIPRGTTKRRIKTCPTKKK